MGAGLLQPTHIIFVIVIALLVFGPKRLPEMGRSIGHGIREFKDSIDGNSSSSDTHEATMTDVPQEPVRVAELPPAGPPPAAPAAVTEAPSAASTPRPGSGVSR
jgi:sec-independent protein translocase protein TatA